MKIKMFHLTNDEMEDIITQFNTHIVYGDCVIVDSKELATMEFDDWLENWVAVGYSIVWNNNNKHFELIDVSKI